MFTWFNKNIRQNSFTQFLRRRSGKKTKRAQASFFGKIHSSRGQIAIILILITAIALIFYAVTLNLNRVGQIKNVTTIAATVAASQLGSLHASYGESIVQVHLGGGEEKCGRTSVVKAVVSVIVAIIGLVLAIYTGGTSIAIAAAIIGIILATAALVIQITVIQPGLTAAWNRLINDTMDTTDRFVENTIQTALRNVITDNIKVVDLRDGDLDQLYAFDQGTGEPEDYIPRFAYHYQGRIMRMDVNPQKLAIDAFLAALRAFLYKQGPADDWGLWDRIPDCTAAPGHQCCQTNAPAWCYPCCVPSSEWDQCCNLAPSHPESCAIAGYVGCANTSPYWTANPNIYNRFSDDPFNNVIANNLSFREKVGRDDEHQLFVVDSAATGSFDRQIAWDDARFPIQSYGNHLRDGTSFYAKAPPLSGIYPALHKMADYEINIRFAPPYNSGFQAYYTSGPLSVWHTRWPCHWCDPRFVDPLSGGPIVCPSDPFGTPPPGLTPLTLNFDPNILYGPFPFIGGACLDATNVTGGEPPQVLDWVDAPRGFFTPYDQCPGDRTSGRLWKRGNDNHCTVERGTVAIPANSPTTAPPATVPAWPYYSRCTKHGTWGSCLDAGGSPDDCLCGEHSSTIPAYWNDDLMDDLIFGLDAFISWAEVFLERDPEQLYTTFREWYPEVAEWTEEAGGFLSRTYNGTLWDWMNDIDAFVDPIRSWLNDPLFAVPPANWDAAWCGHDAATYPQYVSNAERAVWASTGSVGTLDDIINCLDWNGNDGGGNATKFGLCKDAVSCFVNLPTCTNLPRTLLPSTFIPGYTPAYSDTLGRLPALQAFQTCFANCTMANCGTLNTTWGAPYTWPGPFTPGGDCTPPSAWNPTPWFNAFLNNIVIAATGGSCLDINWLNANSLSEIAALNQTEKFRKRAQFLRDRQTEMQQVQIVFDNPVAPLGGFQAFENFLRGPGKDLEDARRDLDETIETGLPFQAVYVWQGPDIPEKVDLGGNPIRPAREGYWHAVRVDARAPGKCKNSCGTLGRNDPPLPGIGTRTRRLGAKRCYYIKDDRGIIKVRVTRWDEDKDPNNLTFNAGMSIWDGVRTFHPQSRRATRAEIDEMIRQCVDPATTQDIRIMNPTGELYAGRPIAEGAFLLDRRQTVFQPRKPQNDLCWDAVHELLANGVTSQACQEYYFKKGQRVGFNSKFIDCPEWD